MSQKAKKRAVSPTREENFAEWFQEVVKISNLAESSSIRGCIIFKPLGFALWDKMREMLDRTFKRLGVQNVYMPLFVPVKDLEKEAKHVEGFAKECAVVTHHRLIQKGDSLIPDPDSKLEELLVVRPTSELLFGEAMARWIHSYRDLPLLLNQWANVVRWEMRTRPFLRTTEFLWQEGHTAHATAKGANENALEMLDVYKRFCHDILAIDVIPGQKSESEKFPGADITYTNEAIMQDKKALQACTSHDLGQNFSKACQIRFSTIDGGLDYAYTTSWGLTTRMIGALLMSHGDDDGAVYPPKIAPIQIGIVPFLMKEEDREAILSYVNRLVDRLSSLHFNKENLRVDLNLKDERASEKRMAI